ncbi:zinc finger protein on ecdysone puffs-like isoform X2 [Haliotis asinina]|uniref:zinc finger protein on ecdysone puffs-like isoform X2 n=1 Tax=Haliotis asinina TaxID=109174 RepID=UPI0035327E64
MVWGQNQGQQNYVGQMGMGNMNMQGMGSLGMGAGGRGILGEPPVSGSNMGIGGLNNMQGMMASSGSSDNIDTMIQQRRLQQQLSLRESQLALASNLLQKQNQLIMDVGMPGSIGPMLPSPPGMSRSMIPSLLDMPSRHNKRSVPMNRDLDVKRRRRDSSSPSDNQRGRNRSSDFDRRRDLDRYSPSRRREEHTSRRDRPSRFSRRDSDELPRRRSRNDHEEYDPAKPTDDEMPGLELADSYRRDDRGQRNFRDHMSSSRHKDRMSDVLNATSKKSSHVEARLKAQEHLKRIESTRVGFCKVCDQELSIPFLRHKLTTLHKKREMQVRKGCGWCGVKNFLNFSEVLKHRERQIHKENAAKYGKKPEANVDSRRTDTRSERSSNLVTVDSVGYSPNGENRRSRPRTAVRPGYSPRSLGRSETSRSGTSKSAAKSDTKEVDLCPELQFEPDTAVGQNYVIPVSGFFCKLCHKFYNTETAAKVTHCQSQAHFNMFKKAKNAAKARALAQKKTSTVSTEDETKQGKEETNSAQAEQVGEDKEVTEKQATEAEGLEETENQNGEDTKGPVESEDGQGDTEEGRGETEEGRGETEEGQGETEEGQGETEEAQGQVSEAAEEFDQDEEAMEDMKADRDDYPEADEKHLTEEEQEEKLLEKDDNESEAGDVLGDIFDEDDTAIIDLADGSSETAGEEKDTELPVQESEEAAEQVDEIVEEAPATDTSPVVRGRGRGRGRGVGRRGRRGKK